MNISLRVRLKSCEVLGMDRFFMLLGYILILKN